ncbi:hypothetical protein GGR51DRAFT_567228 [Nemania sp. FL0031]|nr:hypothetical protein GGR51DRAFT_567228 [Nemania sp. FL0031]
MDTSKFLDFLASGRAWTMRNRTKALAFGVIQDYMSSWLAGDRNSDRHYFTRRTLKVALYESIVGVTIGQVLSGLLAKLFEGSTSFEARVLQVVLGYIIIIPIENTCSQIAMALIDDTYESIKEVEIEIMPTLKPTLVMHLVCSLLAPGFEPDDWITLFDNAWLMLSIYNNGLIKRKRLAAFKSTAYQGRLWQRSNTV